jgi:hypothetical protein
MKTFKHSAAQGDLLIMRIDQVPEGAKVNESEDRAVVAHSETGHNHVIEFDNPQDVGFFFGEDPFTSYIDVRKPSVLKHHRDFDTHEALQIPQGTYVIKRQREWTVEGWKAVLD